MSKPKRAIRWHPSVLAAGCLLLLAAGLLIFIGVSPGLEGGNGNDSDAPARPVLRKVRIVLNEYPNAGHAFLFAAEAKGYLREQGFVLEPIVAGPADDPLHMVDEGKADLALASQPDVLLARNEGRAVVSIAAIVPKPLVYLMVERDSPIHQPAHLDGKVVAISGSPVHEAMLETILDSVKGEKPEVTLVNAANRFAGVMREGEADALLGPTILEGRRRLEQNGIDVRLIEPMLYGVPSYYEIVLVASERDLAEERESVERIWTALARGFDYVAEEPEEAAKLLSGAGVFDGSPAWTVSLETLQRQLPFMRSGGAAFGSQDKQAWKETEKWLTRLDLIDGSLDADDAFIPIGDIGENPPE